MKRQRVLIAGLVLGAAGPGVAASAAHAQGITNPAKNPFPVTVTIDGQTYGDGRDTLPGYDDELCTPIPAVQYDFAENQILYYNNEGELLKTARWTEWSRISSYQTWLDQQNAGTPTPTATATATATPAPTNSAPTSSESTSTAPTSSATQGPASSSSTTTKSPASKKSTTKKNTTSTKKPASERPSATRQSPSSPASPSTTSTTSKQPTAAPTRQSSTSTGNDTATNDAAAPAPTVDGATGTTVAAGASAPVPGAATPAPGTAPVSSAASPEPTTKFKLASERVGSVGMGDTRPAGIGILVALLALAGISFLFRGYARR